MSNEAETQRVWAWFDVLLLGVPAVWFTARVAATNISALPHIERLIVISLLAWLGCTFLYLMLSRLSGSRRASAYAVFSSAILVFGGGAVARGTNTLVAVVLSVSVGVLVFVLTRPRQDSYLVMALTVGLAVAIISGPLLALFQSLSGYGPSQVHHTEIGDIALETRPDIWLVVLDGYPGWLSMSVAHDQPLDPELVAALEEADFTLPESVWAAYPFTMMSVPSLLDMGYPVTAGPETDATTTDLYEIVGGDNELVRVLEANGYEEWMVESAWSGSSCNAWFDHCVAAPLRDAASDVLMYQSVLGALPVSQPGVSFGISSIQTMEWLVDHAGADDGDAPRFVFAHVLAPHPPLYLKTDCEISLEPDGNGFFYPYPGVDAETRDALFFRQVDCVNGFITRLVSELDRGSTVILVGDHGTGRGAQTAKAPDEWTDRDVIERMNPFLAIRLADSCDIGDHVTLPNLMRRVLECYGDSEVGDLDERTFLAPDYELDPDRLGRLVGDPAG